MLRSANNQSHCCQLSSRGLGKRTFSMAPLLSPAAARLPGGASVWAGGGKEEGDAALLELGAAGSGREKPRVSLFPLAGILAVGVVRMLCSNVSAASSLQDCASSVCLFFTSLLIQSINHSNITKEIIIILAVANYLISFLFSFFPFFPCAHFL